MVNRMRQGAVVLLALALLLLSWGHQPLRIGPNLSAYAMPDGSLPELCLPGGGETAAMLDPCPVCTLVTALCGTSPGLPRLAGVVRLAEWHWPAAHLLSAALPRAPPARGPPAIPMV